MPSPPKPATRLARAAPVLLLPVLLSACKEENRFVAPPPPEVTVAQPLPQPVTPWLETTGSTAAVATVDLVARVPGFLEQIGYQDGQGVRKGTVLFTIEQAPYQTSLAQAEASVAAAQAALKQAEVEYQRQSTLGRQDFAAQSVVDQALAQRDEAHAKLQQAQADAQTAQLNLSYTQVSAPFDGVVTAHLVSAGELVGQGTPTKLASIVQLDPIWVNFTISERDILRIRRELVRQGIHAFRLDQVVVEIGLQDEDGYPVAGRLDYISPVVDPGTGTQALRAVFANPDGLLLPGFFVRLRLRTGRPAEALLVPETALGADQSGRYVLVVGAGEVVEQRGVRLGGEVGAFRVVESGLAPGDRVVVNGLQRAVPGARVAPRPTTLEPPPSAPAAEASAARAPAGAPAAAHAPAPPPPAPPPAR